MDSLGEIFDAHVQFGQLVAVVPITDRLVWTEVVSWGVGVARAAGKWNGHRRRSGLVTAGGGLGGGARGRDSALAGFGQSAMENNKNFYTSRIKPYFIQCIF